MPRITTMVLSHLPAIDSSFREEPRRFAIWIMRHLPLPRELALCILAGTAGIAVQSVGICTEVLPSGYLTLTWQSILQHLDSTWNGISRWNPKSRVSRISLLDGGDLFWVADLASRWSMLAILHASTVSEGLRRRWREWEVPVCQAKPRPDPIIKIIKFQCWSWVPRCRKERQWFWSKCHCCVVQVHVGQRRGAMEVLCEILGEETRISWACERAAVEFLWKVLPSNVELDTLLGVAARGLYEDWVLSRKHVEACCFSPPFRISWFECPISDI